jgi:predicted phage terminase large subunit-like protein
MFPTARTVDPEAERLKLELRLALLEGQEQAQDTFIGFSRYVWPEAIISSHHEIMASAFDRIANGTLKRLIVNMPPRHTKSEFASYLLPAYIMGKKPDTKIIQATHTGELAVRFGRKVRNLMDLDRYKEVFSGVALKADSKAAGRWDTDAGGEYFAVGVGGAMTGRGADMLIIDDPHALEVSTPIPTPRGFVEIQHLRVGDEVFGPDGKTTVVTAKSPVYEDRPLYSVLTDDGCEIICDSEHLWGVNSDTNLTKARVVSKTARELSQWSKPNKPILPRVNPVEYPKANLPIDPWVLGAWLGDGTSSSGRMTADPKTGDQEYMISEFRRLGYEVSPVTGDGWTFTVYGLHAQLKLLGVINNKHIPDVYLRGSVEQRMSLLQGLVDTDGCVLENGQAGFYNCNKNMVMAVVALLHSLGVKACLRSYDDKRERFATAKTNHRVMFRLAQCARMPRKLKNAYTPTDKRGRSIEVNALPERGSVQCITVDRTDGLFLAGHGYVVTHNSEQDAQSALALENAWEWYTSGPRTRLQPGGAIVIVMCMTGDTPVLMADGVEKPLSELRRGDMVATFDKGRLRTAKVNNWKSSGVDTIYKIRTQSGKILRANARHPFLVMNEGVLEWTRLTQLSVGDELVSLKDAIDPRVLKQSPVSVAPAKPQIATIGKTQTLRDAKLVTTVSGRAKRALQKIAAIPPVVVACVPSITIKSISRLNRQKQPANTGLKAGTALLLSSMTQWCSNAVTDVMSVVSRLQSEIHALTGTGSCVLTTATTQGEYEGYSATTVTSQLGTERRPLYLNELHRISDFTTDPIASITPDGNEEVFDVEIDRTENFIANGVVSHNTRWGTKDLTARLLKAQSTNNADQWEVIEFPAVFDEGEENERALWPSFWKLEELRAVRASMSVQKWNAMYQQKPTADEGAILKREWWKLWEHDHLPDVEYIIQSYDTAYSKKETADYSVITTWGVFFPTEDSGPNIMLMDVRKGRWDFPDLKRQAKEQYDYWQPDNVLIEAKATGTTLQQELRRMGIPVTMYSPGGRRAGQDKVSRANSVAPILESGMVWATDDDWAQDLIEECAAFPNGDNDDQVDSTTQALTRFRAGNFISLHTDQEDEPKAEGLVPEYY